MQLDPKVQPVTYFLKPLKYYMIVSYVKTQYMNSKGSKTNHSIQLPCYNKILVLLMCAVFQESAHLVNCTVIYFHCQPFLNTHMR